ncbi:MAG: dihydrodipicolinate synthase family protein [Chloroflexi bacterium]|nr:dihydrodipicolinate synthase family protein [Chloroflexota bacterium]
MRSWLCGPMVAVATPFTEDYTLDLDALQDNIRFMIDRGVRTGQGSLLVGGAGGEHPTLNIDERKAVMSAALEAAQGEVPVLSSIQHTDTRVIVELARHASKVGLDGAQLGPTYYYTPTEGDVLRLFEMVARESDVSLMIYHTWWEGLNMSLDLLQRLAEMESVRALKWSAPDPEHYRQTQLALADTLVIIDNSGEQVSSHVMGARGFITHLSGFWPEYPLEIWRLLEQGDYVAAKDKLSSFKWKWNLWRNRVAQVTGGEGPFIKAAMEAVGLRTGPPRPPSVRPPKHLLDELQVLLDSASVPKARAG